MEGLMEMAIALVTGAAGGNIAGKLMKGLSLGTLWNSVVGIVGGGIGSQVLAIFGLVSGGGDMGSILGAVAGGGVGGGVLLAVVGVIKKAMGGGGNSDNS